MSDHFRAMLLVAENEITLLYKSPIVIIFSLLMLIFALTNAAGSSVVLQKFSFLSHDDAFFYVGIGNFFWDLSMLFSFLAMCIGIISFTSEQNGAFRVLLTKPLYRRDVMGGKFIGILSFLLVMVVLTVVLFISLVMIVYGGPGSLTELLLRTGSFILLLFLNCSFTAGIAVMFTVILKKAEAVMASIAFVAAEYLTRMRWIPASIGDLKILNPVNLYVKAFEIEPRSDLVSISLPYGSWLGYAMPYVFLMLAEVVIIILVNSMIFNKKEL